MDGIRENTANVYTVANRMNAVSSSIAGICADINVESLGESAGDTADALIALGKNLSSVGMALSELASRSETAIRSAARHYEEADSQSAQYHYGKR